MAALESRLSKLSREDLLGVVRGIAASHGEEVVLRELTRVTGAARAASASSSSSSTAAASAPGAKGNPPPPPPSTKEKMKNKKNKKKRKKKREFDWSKAQVRPIALRFAYDGGRFHGLVEQDDQPDTVEAHLFAAMAKTCLIPGDRAAWWPSFTRCGRTDRGVSAFSQVCSLDLRTVLGVSARDPEYYSEDDGDGGAVVAGGSGGGVGAAAAAAAAAGAAGAASEGKMKKKRKLGDGGESKSSKSSKKSRKEIDYVSTLNRVLPPDIRVIASTPAPARFNARFGATHRTYRYFFLRRDLDLAAMRDAARRFEGKFVLVLCWGVVGVWFLLGVGCCCW